MTYPPLAVALSTPGADFSRADVALLMATAFRWGYERRADEEEELWERVRTQWKADETIRDLERKARRDGKSQWWVAPPQCPAGNHCAPSATP